MDVLWATSNLPDPTLGGGAALEHELLRQATRRHRVTLVTGGLRTGDRVPDALAALDLVEVIAAGAPHPRSPGRVRTLLRSLAGPPFEFWMAGPKVSEVGRQVAQRSADLVHVMWAETAPVAIAAARRGPTAFLATDAFTRHEERALAQATTARQRLYHWLQLRRTRAWERTYRKAGCVAAVSPIDAAVFAAIGVPAGVVPVVLGDEWFAAPDVEPDPDRVSFVAALDYGPNQDAAGWLLDAVWPTIRATRPATQLHLVGRNPSSALRAAASDAGAVLHADVDDVRPHYWRSSAVVIPVRLGSGTRTKVLHAMACGVPVVATSAACEGMAVTPGAHLLVADDAAGLAAAAVETLGDPPAGRRRAEAAAAFAAGHRAAHAGEALEDLWARARGAARP